LQLAIFRLRRKIIADFPQRAIHKTVVNNLRKLILIALIFNSIFVFSQTKKDTIIFNFKNQISSSSLSRENSKTGEIKKWKVFKFCSEWINEIEYLASIVTNEEVIDFKKDENATLNIIGIIIDLKRNIYKEFALSELDKLIKKPTKYVSIGCYDAMSVYSISYYFLYLLQSKNEVFRPNFELRKKEITEWEIKIMVDEEREGK